jgi:uncharacterized membrane protein
MTLPYDRTLARAGRICFAIALIAFGIANFVVGDFVAGRAPAWPAGLPGRLVWAILSGALFIVAGARMRTGRHATRSLVVVSAMIAAWAVLRHLPLAAADKQLGGAWTNLGKALAFAGGALGVAASITTASPVAWIDARRARLLDGIGRWSLGVFFFLAGVQHFLFATFVATLVPSWVPGAMFWTYFAGVALLGGGLGLIIPRTARLAAALDGFMVFCWLWMLHIPRAISMNNQNEWTAVIEALAVAGIAWSLTVAPRDDEPSEIGASEAAAGGLMS